MEPRLAEDSAERVDVAPVRAPGHQCRFHQRRSTSHERVVHDVVRLCEPIDEEAGKLWLEAGAVRNLVQAMCGALLRSPELIRECAHADRLMQVDADFNLA